MSVIPTPQQIRNEGQFHEDHFPKDLFGYDDFNTLITNQINSSVAQVRLSVGTTNFETDDPDKEEVIRTAIVYRTVGYLWQRVKNVIDNYDEEPLPPEIVSSEEAGLNRDWYLEQSDSLLKQFDILSADDPNLVRPILKARGVDDDIDSRPESMFSRWKRNEYP